MDEHKIDLSVIDPSRDGPRWERLVQSVAARALGAHRRRLTVGFQLLAWGRPALAIAASVALVSWAGSLVAPKRGTPATQKQEDPAIVLAQWAGSDERPAPSQILRVLGEPHGDN